MDIQSIFSQSSSSMDCSQTDQVVLPEEKICDVFSYLSVVDLRARTVTVCKQWQRISGEYLEKAESQEYQETRETIEHIIKGKIWGRNKRHSTRQSLENLLDKNRDKIKSSFALKRQAAKILEEWLPIHEYINYEFSRLNPSVCKRAKDLGDIAWYRYKFEMLKWGGECDILDEMDTKYPVSELNFKQFYEICLKLIELSNFDMASKCALEIKSDKMKFRQEAYARQEEAFARIAYALTKQGYFGNAVEIAQKDIYPGLPERNSRYKFYIWVFISEGLKELNYTMPKKILNLL